MKVLIFHRPDGPRQQRGRRSLVKGNVFVKAATVGGKGQHPAIQAALDVQSPRRIGNIPYPAIAAGAPDAEGANTAVTHAAPVPESRLRLALQGKEGPPGDLQPVEPALCIKTAGRKGIPDGKGRSRVRGAAGLICELIAMDPAFDFDRIPGRSGKYPCLCFSLTDLRPGTPRFRARAATPK